MALWYILSRAIVFKQNRKMAEAVKPKTKRKAKIKTKGQLDANNGSADGLVSELTFDNLPDVPETEPGIEIDASTSDETPSDSNKEEVATNIQDEAHDDKRTINEVKEDSDDTSSGHDLIKDKPEGHDESNETTVDLTGQSDSGVCTDSRVGEQHGETTESRNTENDKRDIENTHSLLDTAEQNSQQLNEEDLEAVKNEIAHIEKCAPESEVTKDPPIEKHATENEVTEVAPIEKHATESEVTKVSQSLSIVEPVEIAACPTDRKPDDDESGSGGMSRSSTTVSEEATANITSPTTSPPDTSGGVYPKLQEQEEPQIKPLTSEQLQSLYHNPQLLANEHYTEAFLKDMNKEKHEFYEIVLDYYRACNHLASAEHDIQVLRDDYEMYQSLVWSSKQQSANVQGYCQDGAKVQAVHTYQTAEFDELALLDAEKTLKNIRTHIHDELCLHAYEVQLSRLQVECYIHSVYASSPVLLAIPPNSPVQCYLPQKRDSSGQSQINNLNDCISVLFMFQRKPSKDSNFVRDTRNWLSRMIASLLRVATITDHAFILNHLIRCPGGVGKWAASFVQMLPPVVQEDQSTLGSPLLDHILSVIATILKPAKGREENLYQMKVQLTPSVDKSNENPWILVDSDGEEDEDPENSWWRLQENDLVSLLNQIPMEDVFKHVLLIIQQRGDLYYNVHQTNYSGMMKLYAFASCVVNILGMGLDTFSLGRYRQLNKRLARMIRHVAQYVSDHWVNYSNNVKMNKESQDRLQVEFDSLFYKAASCLLAARRLGSWQFLASMPYNCVSQDMMWRLATLMHQGCQNMAMVDQNLTAQQCKDLVADQGSKHDFEDQLIAMPTSEAIYLLTTLANMARSRLPDDSEFVEAIALQIYEIAYIRSHTREFCSKSGRELLFSISSEHPYVISRLLRACSETMELIGLVSLSLFQGLPLHLWHPLDTDMVILRGWILDKSISSPENQLARLVFHDMNWQTNEKASDLFLDLEFHRQVAVLLVEAHVKHLNGKHIAGLFTEGSKQMKWLGFVPRAGKGYENDEQNLCEWTWEMALQLHLHQDTWPRSYGSMVVPELEDAQDLQPIFSALKQQFALPSYLALEMTKYGHSVAEFCSVGVKHLQKILEKYQYIPAIRAISHFTPLFYNTEYLMHNQMFLQCIHLLLCVDQNRRSMFSWEFPGPITKLFFSMIQSKIEEAGGSEGVGSVTVIMFWLNIFTRIKHWYTDRYILYVIDGILESTYRIQGAADTVNEFFFGLFKEHQKSDDRGHGSGGFLSNMVSWLATGPIQPSFIDGVSCPEFPWYAFAVLNAETWHEEGTHLWLNVQKALYNNNEVTVEAAFKEAMSVTKQESGGILQRLCIYRWAQQAVDMEISHPLLPLVWQKFFILHLGRMAAQPGLPQRRGVGEKFFDSGSNISLLRRMKRRLQETSDYYNNLVSEQTPSTNNDSSDDVIGAVDENLQRGATVGGMTGNNPRKEFYGRLVRFFQTISFWLDEPRLHDANLYLPALPPQYDAERLNKIFQGDKTPWYEFMDNEVIDKNLRNVSEEWYKHVISHTNHDHKNIVDSPNDKSATQRIMERLKPVEKPIEPPSMVDVKAPVPELNPSILLNKQSLLFALRSDFNCLVDFAKVYSLRVSRHVALDCTFIELLPDLHFNDTTEATLTVPCKSTFNPTHRCKGAAVLTCRYDAEKRNDIINRKIDENRAEYKQLMIENLLPPPSNVCGAAVHLRNAIASLIKLTQTTGDLGQKAAAVDVGINLFYYTSTFVSENTKFYLPTRQFFSSCIEMLGQEFIRNNPTQSQPLLQAILQTPSIAGLLAPNFSPNATPELFVSMYEDMARVPQNQGPELAFTLQTKFDTSQWLAQSRPAFSQRSSLIDIICSALTMCGHIPGEQLRLVFELYRSDLQHLLLYNFPDHFGEILKLILKGSCAGFLSPEIWTDMLETLGCKTSENPEEGAGFHYVKPSVSSHSLSYKTLKETTEYLSSYFCRLRMSNTDIASFGLYPKWKVYVPCLATFLGYLSTNSIAVLAKDVSHGTEKADDVVLKLWQDIKELFSPWIQPLDNSGLILSPWIPSDSALALHMVLMFTSSIHTLHHHFHDTLPVISTRQPLALLWPFYVSTLATEGTPDHVVDVFHSKLTGLPWATFYPDLEALDLMIQVTLRYPSGCRQFVGKLVTSMSWSNIISYYTDHLADDMTDRLHVSIFNILVQLGRDTTILEETSLVELLHASENFQWYRLDARNFESTLEAFLHQCNPRCIMLERSQPEAQVLRVIKTASGFGASVDTVLHIETSRKRVAYLNFISELICKCSHLNNVKIDAFQPLVSNILTELETVVNNLGDENNRTMEAVALSKEVLGILNNCNPKGGTIGIVLQAMLDWIHGSPGSVLLHPLINAACKGLADVSVMVHVIEACMDAHFMTDHTQDEMCGWSPLMTMLQVPDLNLNQFINNAISQGCFLTMNCYICQQLPLSQHITDEFSHLESIVQWNNKVKPNSSNEGKLLLLWGKAVELVVRQLDFGGPVNDISRQLFSFIPSVALQGEDKDTSGLLGAIGLGKKSQLSLRFRLMAKCLSTYLSAQVPNDSFIRTVPGAPGYIRDPVVRSPGSTHPSSTALQHLLHLESLRNNKLYLPLKEDIEYAISFITNAEHTIRETPILLTEMIRSLFPDVNCLAVMRPRITTPSSPVQ